MRRWAVAVGACAAVVLAGCTGSDSSKDGGLPDGIHTQALPSSSSPARPTYITSSTPVLTKGRDFKTVATLPAVGPGLESIWYSGVTTHHLAYGIANDVNDADPYDNGPRGRIVLTDLKTKRTSFIYHAGERGYVGAVVASADWIVWAEAPRTYVTKGPGAQTAWALYSFQRSNGVVRRILAAPVRDSDLWLTFYQGGDLGIVNGTVYFQGYLGSSETDEGVWALNPSGSSAPSPVIKHGEIPSFGGNRILYLQKNRFYTTTAPKIQPVPVPHASKHTFGFAYGGTTLGFGLEKSDGVNLNFVNGDGRLSDAGLVRALSPDFHVGDRFAAFQEGDGSDFKARTFLYNLGGKTLLRVPGSLYETPILTSKSTVIIQRLDKHHKPATNTIIDLK
jgi:hypothetical protein